MNTNTTARPSARVPGQCAHCRRAIQTHARIGWIHADNGARHCAWSAARVVWA